MPNEKSGWSKQSAWSRRNRSETADIGVIPAIVDIERRRRCERELERFLVEYFPGTTGLSPFSADHKRVISRIEECVIGGGRFANVVYRGFAKTTIVQNAAIWAALYGHRRFVAVFGADATAASGSLDSIKMELSENELLYGDFPEVCHAIWALEGKPQRCASQTHVPGNVEGFNPADGAEAKMTHIRWTAEKIVLPTIWLPDGPSKSSGAIISTRGVTGGSRGLNYKRSDGTQQRPDFVMIDDPQTDDSASTELQVRNRLTIIKKAILKLGGHNRQLAVVMNATPIQVDDVVEQLLDPVRNPSWQSERIPMVRKWADNHALWMEEYARLRNTFDPDTIGDQKRARDAATKFYAERRAEMDAGCVVSWDSCFDPEVEISAIQHAYNALIDDGEETFQSECQCRPLRNDVGDADVLSVDDIARRTNGLPRRKAPSNTVRITAFVDVQQTALFYAVCAWSDSFTGAVIDYGVWPEQGSNNVTLKKLRKKLADVTPGAGIEGSIHAGITALLHHLMGVEWAREDGAKLRIDQCLVDSGYQAETVYSACRASPFAASVYPSKGQPLSARSLPINEWAKKAGERFGNNHVVSPTGRGRMLAKFDANYWKTFIRSRLQTAIGDPGALTFWGKNPEEHKTIAAHCKAEYSVRTEGRGRQIDEWQIRPEKPDNHWWDCLVGCAVGASIAGVKAPGYADSPKPRDTGPRIRVNIPAAPGRNSFFITSR